MNDSALWTEGLLPPTLPLKKQTNQKTNGVRVALTTWTRLWPSGDNKWLGAVKQSYFFLSLTGGAGGWPSSHEELCDQVLGGRDDDGGGGQLQEAVQEACGRADAGGTEEAAHHAARCSQAQDETAQQQEEEQKHHQGKSLELAIASISFGSCLGC